MVEKYNKEMQMGKERKLKGKKNLERKIEKYKEANTVELRNVIADQLKQAGVKADPKCKKCHGQGYEGYNYAEKHLVYCKCITKSIIELQKKEKENAENKENAEAIGTDKTVDDRVN
jgi:hypothetical protein